MKIIEAFKKVNHYGIRQAVLAYEEEVQRRDYEKKLDRMDRESKKYKKAI